MCVGGEERGAVLVTAIVLDFLNLISSVHRDVS